MERDPVCEMEVDPQNPPGGSYEYEGKTYYFCADGCRKQFEENPKAFLTKEAD